MLSLDVCHAHGWAFLHNPLADLVVAVRRWTRSGPAGGQVSYVRVSLAQSGMSRPACTLSFMESAMPK